jgi:hypothetical protein
MMKRYFFFACCLHHAGSLLGLVMMEAIFSSETSGDFQRTKLRFNPEERTLQIECPLSLTLFFSNTHLHSHPNAP